MQNYWKAKLKNGNEVNEHNSKWNDIKDNILELSMVLNNSQTITLPKNLEYIQAKTASADFNGGNAAIESRYIAVKYRNNTIIIRVDEKTNNISLEIQ